MRRAARERPPVLVVDDDAAFRKHVRIVLEDAGYGVLESGTAEDALRIARDEEPPLAVLDVHLPGMSGYEVCRALREELGQRIGIIFLSGSKVETIDRAAGLTLGADDYILKPFEPEELVARVRALLRRVAPETDAFTSFAGSTGFDLTPRELEVLRLLADGLDQDEIAQRLFITPKTVATHIERILGKLGVRSRAQAVALAYREELVNTGQAPLAAQAVARGGPASLRSEFSGAYCKPCRKEYNLIHHATKRRGHLLEEAFEPRID